MFAGLLEIIEEAPIITIARHIHADMDALGSQYGLKYWIMENYPDKKVYALGEEQPSELYEESDKIEDSIIENSLAIVLDVSGTSRIDDQRILKAKKILCIDHHPETDHFMDYIYRFTGYAATCEILADFFNQTNKRISKKVATALYRGLLTDTASFKTNNTTANTLKMAYRLAQAGVDIVQCNRDVFDIDKKTFEFTSYLRSHATIEESGLVYTILSIDECKRFGLTPALARDQVHQLANVKEFEIWCVFSETEQGVFAGSLRSKQKSINGVAAHFNGGGHPCASGVKGLSIDDVNKCLDELRNVIKS